MLNELEKRKRKMLLLGPVLVVPLLCMVFYGLGGGHKGGTVAQDAPGLNLHLPVPRLEAKAKGADKMSLYIKAAADSAKMAEKIKLDPYRRIDVDTTVSRGPVYTKAPEADQVMSRLEQLKKVINEAGEGGNLTVTRPDHLALADTAGRWSQGVYGQWMDKLHTGAGTVPAHDPEMERLNAMLDKVLRIQHPTEVVKDTGHLDAVPLVHPVVVDQEDQDGGFMEVGGPVDTGVVGSDAMEAVVNSAQTLTAGSTVALRLLAPVQMGTSVVAANTLVYGLATLSGERLRVHVSSIRAGASIIAVSLDVYDLDGQAGIRVPGALSREVTKESADEAISSLGIASVDPTLGGQAAAAGIQMAKSLASRKVRQVRVFVEEGYRVLLKNDKKH